MDYGARFYDPAIGRFTGVDPLASNFASLNPYNYTLNNPINLIDPSGMAAEDPILLIWATGEGDQGHTSFAVENYSLNDDGEFVSSGTYSIFEVAATEEFTTEQFARDPGMSIGGSISRIPGDFSKDDVLNFTRNGKVADAAIEFSSTPEEDYNAGQILNNDRGSVNYSLSEATSNSDSGNCTYSCASFAAKYGSALYPSMSLDKSTERITHGGIKALGIPPVDMNAFTPRSLYQGAKGQGTLLRNNAKRFSLPFINTYSGTRYRDTAPKQ